MSLQSSTALSPHPINRVFQRLFLFLLAVSWLSSAQADTEWRHALEARAFARSDTQLELQWKPAQRETAASPASYFVSRRSVGMTTWPAEVQVTENLNGNYVFRDPVQTGTRYEYRIRSTHAEGNGYAYVQGGTKVPFLHDRGTVLLIVENSLYNHADVKLQVDIFATDLVGDGWKVVTKTDILRGSSPEDENTKAAAVQQFIRTQAPADTKAVVLLGAVPYVKVRAPAHADGHNDVVNRVVASDAYYGDLNGNWGSIGGTPPAVDTTGYIPVDSSGGNTRTVELQVGRIDMRELTVYSLSEKDLVLRYLQKNHDYRHNGSSATGALWADSIGWKDNAENPAANGFRVFGPTIGIASGAVTVADTAATTRANSWLGKLTDTTRGPYVWAWGSGYGGYDPAVGHSMFRLRENQGVATSKDIADLGGRALFYLTFGSYGADFHERNSILRTFLATPEFGLAAAWGGRPFLHLHGMGLGETIGECFRRSQNNARSDGGSADNYDTSAWTDNLQRVHMSLMGDPTLRLHAAPPVRNVTHSVNAGIVTVTWHPPTNPANLVGYHVYRGTSMFGPFAPITGSTPITDTNCEDRPGEGVVFYMVRAIYLQDGPSGSYFNGSQGIYSSGTVAAPTFSIPSSTYPQPQSVTLNSATPDAEIRFTTNNSEPTPTNGTVYSQPITISSTTTLKAVAYKAGLTTSAVSTATYTIAGDTISEAVWFDDALPAGAGGTSSTSLPGDWVWGFSPDTPARRVHVSPATASEHSHWFGWSNNNLSVGANDKLYAYVYIDPANIPEQIVISWSSPSSWNHRAYWGLSRLPWGTEGTPSMYRVGNIPQAGGWVRLEVDAASVGMTNEVATGVKFTTYKGRVYWDTTGKSAPSAGSAAAPAFSPGSGTYSQPQSVTLNTATAGATLRYTLDGSTPSSANGFMYNGQPIAVSSTTTLKAYASKTGLTDSPVTSATYTFSSGTEVEWFNDNPPAGAGGVSSTSVANSWISGTSPDTPSRPVHISPNNTNEHSHWFGWSNQNLSVGPNDKLYAWVFIDPANVPEEIVISWSTSSSWDHRAYWGLSRLPWGTEGTPSLYRAGNLPAAGVWVKLEVDAASVGMSNQVATGMKFTTFKGRVYWDTTGKKTP